MAKRKVEIGSIIKGQDGKADYFKVRGDHQLKDGEFLNLESKQDQLKDIQYRVDNLGLKEESAEKMREFIEKTPSWVRFKVTVLREVTSNN